MSELGCQGYDNFCFLMMHLDMCHLNGRSVHNQLCNLSYLLSLKCLQMQVIAKFFSYCAQFVRPKTKILMKIRVKVLKNITES